MFERKKKRIQAEQWAWCIENSERCGILDRMNKHYRESTHYTVFEPKLRFVVDMRDVDPPPGFMQFAPFEWFAAKGVYENIDEIRRNTKAADWMQDRYDVYSRKLIRLYDRGLVGANAAFENEQFKNHIIEPPNTRVTVYITVVTGQWLTLFDNRETKSFYGKAIEQLYNIWAEFLETEAGSLFGGSFAKKQRSAMTPGLRYEILQRDGFRCVKCGRSAEEDGVKLHVDHIVPISKGGKTERDNLQTLCANCNLGKGTRF